MLDGTDAPRWISATSGSITGSTSKSRRRVWRSHLHSMWQQLHNSCSCLACPDDTASFVTFKMQWWLKHWNYTLLPLSWRGAVNRDDRIYHSKCKRWRYASAQLRFGSFSSVLNKAGAISWWYKGENSRLSRHLLSSVISLKWLCVRWGAGYLRSEHSTSAFLRCKQNFPHMRLVGKDSLCFANFIQRLVHWWHQLVENTRKLRRVWWNMYSWSVAVKQGRVVNLSRQQHFMCRAGTDLSYSYWPPVSNRAGLLPAEPDWLFDLAILVKYA